MAVVTFLFCSCMSLKERISHVIFILHLHNCELAFFHAVLWLATLMYSYMGLYMALLLFSIKILCCESSKFTKRLTLVNRLNEIQESNQTTRGVIWLHAQLHQQCQLQALPGTWKSPTAEHCCAKHLEYTSWPVSRQSTNAPQC